MAKLMLLSKNEDVRTLDIVSDLISGDDLSGMLSKYQQKSELLWLETDNAIAIAKFVTGSVDLKVAETHLAIR